MAYHSYLWSKMPHNTQHMQKQNMIYDLHEVLNEWYTLSLHWLVCLCDPMIFTANNFGILDDCDDNNDNGVGICNFDINDKEEGGNIPLDGVLEEVEVIGNLWNRTNYTDNSGISNKVVAYKSIATS